MADSKPKDKDRTEDKTQAPTVGGQVHAASNPRYSGERGGGTIPVARSGTKTKE